MFQVTTPLATVFIIPQYNETIEPTVAGSKSTAYMKDFWPFGCSFTVARCVKDLSILVPSILISVTLQQYVNLTLVLDQKIFLRFSSILWDGLLYMLFFKNTFLTSCKGSFT